MEPKSSQSIPKSTLKYTLLNHLRWKSHFPKSIRFKLYGFLSLIAICIVMIFLSCLQFCDEDCSGLCNISHLQPNLNRFFSGNYSNLHFSHTSRILPQCIIIGVRKAGTRALLRYLNIHPDIVTSPMELHFFNTDEKYNLSLEYYRKQMPYSLKNQITIEKTPAYFTEPMVPERVYRMNSSIKLLLIVREPVVRLISDYAQLRDAKIKKNKTVIPFDSEVFTDSGDVDVSYKAVQTSIYYMYLGKWLEFFPWDQIHIVDGDQLIKDPYPELHAVETFLNLEHHILKKNIYFNKTKGFYCVNDGTPNTCLQGSKGRKHPLIDPAKLDKLKQFYKPRNQLFFEMANRTFDWS